MYLLQTKKAWRIKQLYRYNKNTHYMFCPKNKIFSKRFLAFMTLCCLSVSLFAQKAGPVPAAEGNNYDTLRYILLAVALVLAFVIFILSRAAGITGEILVKKQKREKENGEGRSE